MPDIHIHRHHHLGLPSAREIALLWAEKAEEKFDMACAYEKGETQDTVYFTRSGVKGTLLVQADQLEFKADLGLLASPFRGRIEAEICEQIDALLQPPEPGKKKKPHSPQA